MLLQLIIFSASIYAGSRLAAKHRQRKNAKLPVQKTPNARISRETNPRTQQLSEIASEDEEKQRPQTQKAMNRKIALAAASVVCSAIGGLFFPPLALLSVPASIYVSLPIYQKAYRALQKGKTNVELLITIVTTGGFLCGYFFIVSLAVLLFSLSFRLLQQVTDNSKHQLIDVFRQQPCDAWLLVDGSEIRVAVEGLKSGQIVAVRGGDRIPVDGHIVAGLASIDEHHLTGESQPTEKSVGDAVFASTIALSGRIEIRVEKSGSETTVAKIGQILNDTTEYKSTAQLRAEQLANKTVVPTLLLSGAALPFLGPMGSLAILNAHFKDKLNIIVPISMVNFLNIASHKGILIKDGRTLDLLNEIDTIVFDKTGTLTEERPQVGEVHAESGYHKSAIIRWAAAVEQKQHHPIAKAILQAATHLEIPEAEETEYNMGYGLAARVDRQWVRAGSLRFMEKDQIQVSARMRSVHQHCHEEGHSLVFVALNQRVIGAIELLPTVRPEIKQVIAQLRKQPNIKELYIISGDHHAPTKKLAEYLEVDHFFAETLPEQKAALIEQLQRQGKSVCYIGDGINDSIALKKSQVSISLRGASSVATDTAQIVLMDGNLTQLIPLFELAREFHRNTNTAFSLLLTPTILGMGGVFFLHFGLAQTISIELAGLGAGLLNSLRPLLQHHRNPE